MGDNHIVDINEMVSPQTEISDGSKGSGMSEKPTTI